MFRAKLLNLAEIRRPAEIVIFLKLRMVNIWRVRGRIGSIFWSDLVESLSMIRSASPAFRRFYAFITCSLGNQSAEYASRKEWKTFIDWTWRETNSVETASSVESLSFYLFVSFVLDTKHLTLRLRGFWCSCLTCVVTMRLDARIRECWRVGILEIWLV